MNKFLAALALVAAVTFAVPGYAQSPAAKLGFIPVPEGVRVLGGISGGDNLGNTFLGLNASLEIPVKTRFEFDLSETFNPIEAHVLLSTGISNEAEITPIIWVGRSWGLAGSYESSIYSVPTITKSYLYAKGGFIFRTRALNTPLRFRVQYFQEVNNGISSNGTETDHVLGGELTTDARIGCFGKVCVRLQEQLIYARALTQGNPVCDGSDNAAVDTCPRGSVLSTGANGSIRFEFPRPRNSGAAF